MLANHGTKFPVDWYCMHAQLEEDLCHCVYYTEMATQIPVASWVYHNWSNLLITDWVGDNKVENHYTSS